MSLIAAIRQRLAVARERSQLRAAEHRLWELDQYLGAMQRDRAALVQHIERLRGRVFAIEPADDIVRRAGVGA